MRPQNRDQWKKKGGRILPSCGIQQACNNKVSRCLNGGAVCVYTHFTHDETKHALLLNMFFPWVSYSVRIQKSIKFKKFNTNLQNS